MTDVTDPWSWVAKAEEDYTVARYALRRRPPLTSIGCFHAQQCAEKYLKAALVMRGREFPKTHDLLALNLLCLEAGLALGLPVTPLGDLSSYASAARYPGDAPTPDEARDALATAKLVRRVARGWLGMK